MMNWRARLLKLDGLMPEISDAGELVWGTLADAAEDAELVFLGRMPFSLSPGGKRIASGAHTFA